MAATVGLEWYTELDVDSNSGSNPVRFNRFTVQIRFQMP
jgi:hypothetical protein